MIGISQSGETADTLAAIRLARQLGARTMAITNSLGSQITREVDAVLYTHAGLEMGVAATKTFTTQVALLSLLALQLAQIRRTMPPDEIEFILQALYDLPEKLGAFLDGDRPIEAIAQRHHDKPFFLYLGRHVGVPVCLEGALKLKEISYIPTEAYAAGEMKHGPIALLDERDTGRLHRHRPEGRLREARCRTSQEVRARGAQVIAIATTATKTSSTTPTTSSTCRARLRSCRPILAVLPLQLLAYRIARLRG